METVVTAVADPQALKPVTVKFDVDPMVNGTPLLMPPVQLYVVAPCPLKAILLLGQIPPVVLVLTIVTVGVLSTVTVMALFAIQPNALVPETAYVVLTVGASVI